MSLDLTPAEVDALRRAHRVLATAPFPLVVAGGWAARLLRLHPLAQRVSFAAVGTSDFDVAVADKPPGRGRLVGEALSAEGFVADLKSDDRPPVAAYVLEDSGFELEFIAPLLARRKQSHTVDVLGASAQKALDVELLLFEPIRLAVPEVGPDSSFLVVNPASFIVQKLLVVPVRRASLKKGKDLLNVHDTLALFTRRGGLPPELVAQGARLFAVMPPKQRKRLAETIAQLAGPDARVAEEAAKQARQSGREAPPTAAELVLAVRLGLTELLGQPSGSGSL